MSYQPLKGVSTELTGFAYEKGKDWKQMDMQHHLRLLEVTNELYAELEAIAKKKGIKVDRLAVVVDTLLKYRSALA